MKSFIDVFFTIFLSCLTVSAAINPYYKEALQRGYAIDGDYVILPDSSRCLLDDFNNQRCGKDFFDLPYCVPEGKYVWDDNACCDGLAAYLPSGVDGQATCQKKGNIDFSETLRNPMLWIGILALTGLLYGGLFAVKKLLLK